MSNWPFRFVHAADLHLERPPFGIGEIPDHLRKLFIEAVYWAAERVFETTLAEEADFLVLSGDCLDPRRTGPRGPLFLAEQFRRLGEQDINVYWAGGKCDSPEQWPSAVPLPDNVHLFPAGRIEEFVYQRDSVPLARVIGTSRGHRRGIRADDFHPDAAGLFSIAVAYGSADAKRLKDRGINYWALGGGHTRHTLFSSPHVAHYPGTSQGRQPNESGPHGCTVVHVDGQRQARTTMVPTDVMRWLNDRVNVDDATTRDDLELNLHERMQSFVESSPGLDLLVDWTITGTGPVMADLRHGGFAAELLDSLRSEFGFGPPAAWSVSLTPEATAVLPAPWYEQQTIRGDFLRAVRHYQMNPEHAIDLEPYLSEQHLAGTMGATVGINDTSLREKVLREVAMLGVDLLSGEEPES